MCIYDYIILEDEHDTKSSNQSLINLYKSLTRLLSNKHLMRVKIAKGCDDKAISTNNILTIPSSLDNTQA